jgi:hypothetical protein
LSAQEYYKERATAFVRVILLLNDTVRQCYQRAPTERGSSISLVDLQCNQRWHPFLNERDRSTGPRTFHRTWCSSSQSVHTRLQLAAFCSPSAQSSSPPTFPVPPAVFVSDNSQPMMAILVSIVDSLTFRTLIMQAVSGLDRGLCVCV